MMDGAVPGPCGIPLGGALPASSFFSSPFFGSAAFLSEEPGLHETSFCKAFCPGSRAAGFLLSVLDI